MFNNNNGSSSGQFDQNIGSWDVSNVTRMDRMFDGWTQGHRFNNGGSSSISGWDTSNVTNMNRVFQVCPLFNQPIGYWNTSKVTNIDYMLYGCTIFDQDLSNWVVSGITSAINFCTVLFTILPNDGLYLHNHDLLIFSKKE